MELHGHRPAERGHSTAQNVTAGSTPLAGISETPWNDGRGGTRYRSTKCARRFCHQALSS
jgi:hypothetical protein